MAEEHELTSSEKQQLLLCIEYVAPRGLQRIAKTWDWERGERTGNAVMDSMALALATMPYFEGKILDVVFCNHARALSSGTIDRSTQEEADELSVYVDVCNWKSDAPEHLVLLIAIASAVLLVLIGLTRVGIEACNLLKNTTD